MTTIAYRDGILASDSRAYSGGSTPIGWKVKVHQFEHGDMMGVSTVVPGLAEQFIAWARGDFQDHEEPELETGMSVSALYINPVGEVFYLNDSLNFAGPLEGEFFAIGSGEHYALGAMAMGASASDAVGIAKMFDVWTDGPVRTVCQPVQPVLKMVG